MDIHGRDLRIQHARRIDAGYMRVECPHHPGVLVPVTGAKIYLKHTDPEIHPHTKQYRMVLEILCRLCSRYHYVEVIEGKATLRWDA